MRTKSVNLFLQIMRPVLGLLLLVLVQSTAMAQITNGPSLFQKEDEKAIAKQKNEVASIYQETHLNRNVSRKKKDATKRQKTIRAERRKLRFNRKGKAVKRRHLRNDEMLYLLEENN